ncbi:MAG: hypothetical protein E7317_01590 [Clostridiales bacterium]|nr:hypothetical protein [Clostridiales bacterium]
MNTIRRAMASLLIVLTLLSVFTTAFASSEYLVSANNVVVRRTPDKAGYKVGNVDKGIKVKRLGSSNGYTKVEILSGRLKGKTGYIFSAYVNKSGKIEDAAKKGVNVVNKAVYLRNAPSKTEGKVIRTLGRREKVKVLSIDSSGWAKVVTSKNETGYCYSTYLSSK